MFKLIFLNSPQNFSTREYAHRNDTQKIYIFSPLHKDLSSTYTVIMMRMLLSIRIRNDTQKICIFSPYTKTFCKERQIVLVLTAEFSVLNTEFFQQEALSRFTVFTQLQSRMSSCLSSTLSLSNILFLPTYLPTT